MSHVAEFKGLFGFWENRGLRYTNVIILLLKGRKGTIKAKWFKESKYKKVLELKEVVYIVIDSMPCMLSKRWMSPLMWLRVC